MSVSIAGTLEPVKDISVQPTYEFSGVERRVRSSDVPPYLK